MKDLVKVSGKDIGVLAYKIEGYEEHGLVFLADRDGDSCGAQCANCNNILWTSVRNNSILSEKKPDTIPNSGTGYRNYVFRKYERFLDSLPACPECQEKHYDVFLTNILYPCNMVFPRFEDGYSYPNDNTYPKCINIDTSGYLVWWYVEE